MKLSTEILNSLIPFACPNCNYELEIQLLDARVQAYRYCPCCRVRIRLIDSDGSMYGQLEAVDLAMHKFVEELKRIF